MLRQLPTNPPRPSVPDPRTGIQNKLGSAQVPPGRHAYKQGQVAHRNVQNDRDYAGFLQRQAPQSTSPNRPAGTPFFQTPAGRGTSNEAYTASAAAQGAKDQAAFSAMGNLGIAGQNAMGQYGMNRDAQLTNQAIAAANAYGSMANSYYNTMGQLGQVGAGLSAAGLNAGAQSAQANMGSNFNLNMGGGMGGGWGGGGGFNASGPEGTIARGSMGGFGGGGFGMGGSVGGGGTQNMGITRGATPQERQGFVNQGYGFLGDIRGDLNNPNNQAMALAGLMGDQFGANRAAVMDPTIVNSLNQQMTQGYGALGGLYGMSDYGFNTGSRGNPGTFTPARDNSRFWLNPQESLMDQGSWMKRNGPSRTPTSRR